MDESINQELSIRLQVSHLKEKSTRMEKGEEGEVSVKKVVTLNTSTDSPPSPIVKLHFLLQCGEKNTAK